jgi:hypothetical protein
MSASTECEACGLDETNCGQPDFCCEGCRALTVRRAEAEAERIAARYAAKSGLIDRLARVIHANLSEFRGVPFESLCGSDQSDMRDAAAAVVDEYRQWEMGR